MVLLSFLNLIYQSLKLPSLPCHLLSALLLKLMLLFKFLSCPFTAHLNLILCLTRELTELFALASSICPAMVLLGDINIHVDNKTCLNTVQFMDTLDCFNITQHVNFPTHNKGHTLDLVCSVDVDINQLESHELPISDHKLLSFNLPLPSSKLVSQRRVISFRNVKNINCDHFASLISEHHDLKTVEDYNSVLSSTLEVLAPRKERVVSFSKTSPWYTSELRLLKGKNRQLERQFKKSGLTVHKQMFDEHFSHYSEALKVARVE